MSSKKSNAKAIGLKSAFVINENEVFMTSFGKGGDALPEKNIEDLTVQNINETFEASVLDKKKNTRRYGISREKLGNATISVPDTAKTNQLGMKGVIEKEYFDDTFADNIHVQLAYNIMDIKKMFAVYANLIGYTIDNVFGLDEEYIEDVLAPENEQRDPKEKNMMIFTVCSIL